jgi:hypothetical protein
MHHMRHFFPAVPLLALAAALLSPPASAQDALALFKRAKELEGQGKWAEAHRLQKDAIGITLNLAECSKHIGKLASAWSAFQEAEFLGKKEHDDDRARFAHDEAAALEPRLSTLKINAAATPGLVIRRDEQEVGRGALGAPFPADPAKTTPHGSTAAFVNGGRGVVLVATGGDAAPKSGMRVRARPVASAGRVVS